MADKIRSNQLGHKAILAYMDDEARMPSLSLPMESILQTDNDTIDGEESPSQHNGGLEGKLSMHDSVYVIQGENSKNNWDVDLGEIDGPGQVTSSAEKPPGNSGNVIASNVEVTNATPVGNTGATAMDASKIGMNSTLTNMEAEIDHEVWS